jgi:hypothetical protein
MIPRKLPTNARAFGQNQGLAPVILLQNARLILT